jgi:cytochrome c-type biogenesis protein CcmH
MSGFWIAAAALGLIAAALVIVPLARAWARDGQRSSATLGVGLVGGLAIPVIALALYANWTSWDWSGSPVASQDANAVHAMEEAIAGLEARLAAQPEDVEGWTMLGRSYMAMRRFDQAARAYRRGLEIDGADSLDLVADLAEALALSDPLGLQGEAGPMFETVLARSPNHPKALWYGGLYAFENSDFPKVEDRLGRLLTLNPPETLVPLIEERLAEARAHAGLPPETFAAAPDSSADAAAGGAPERSPGSKVFVIVGVLFSWANPLHESSAKSSAIIVYIFTFIGVFICL